MFFHGVMVTVSAISDFQKRDQFDLIKGMVGEVKMDWDRFICVIPMKFHPLKSTFSMSLCYCITIA